MKTQAVDMDALTSRLDAAKPKLREIVKVSGTPGAAIGVSKNGKLVWTDSIGVLDVDGEAAPNAESIFHIASLTKAMTAVCIGILVTEGKLKWDTPISTLLPNFKFRNESLKDANIQDLLAHRLGMARYNGFWGQGGNRNHLPKDQLLKALAFVPAVDAFRDSFRYWNFGYSIVGEIIERLSGQTYGTFLTERVLKPLGMDRTIIKVEDPEPDNYASAFFPLSAGGFAKISRPYSRDGAVQGPAGGVRSCVRDLATFYNAVLQARRRELDGDASTTDLDAGVLKAISVITSGHNFVSKTSDHESSLGFGFLRAQLPNTFGAIGYNNGVLKKMPTLGTPADCRLVLYHQGSYPGFLASAFLVPQDDLVITVLSNSLAYNDAADWMGQLLLEEALDLGTHHDFVDLARQVRDKRLEGFADADRRFEESIVTTDPGRQLDAYEGDYYHETGTFFVRVTVAENGLRACFQGYQEDLYVLRVLNADVFSFYETRDDQGKRGRWPSDYLEGFKFTFQANEDGKVVSLRWQFEGDVAEPDEFTRRPLASSSPPTQSSLAVNGEKCNP